MKTISTLKKLIIFYFYFLVIVFVLLIVGLPILFAKGQFTTLEFLDDYDISDLSFGKFLVMVLIGAILYYYLLNAFYLFKKSLNDLSNGNYFSELVINNFNKMGKSFLIFGMGFSLFKFALRLIFISDIRLGISNSLILFSIIGLFFMFLSEAFSKARKTKEENDLTI